MIQKRYVYTLQDNIFTMIMARYFLQRNEHQPMEWQHTQRSLISNLNHFDLIAGSPVTLSTCKIKLISIE